MTTVPIQGQERETYVMGNDGSNYTGVFCNEATIASARSISNEDIYKNGKPVDVGIEFELEIGKDFKPKFNISGNFKVEDGRVVGDGSATRVKIALSRLHIKWERLNPDNSIPQAVLDACVGLKIMRLQFPYKRAEDGKVKYATFSGIQLSSTADAKAKVQAEYDKAVRAGYVKPLVDEAVSFPGPANGTAVKEPDQF